MSRPFHPSRHYLSGIDVAAFTASLVSLSSSAFAQDDTEIVNACGDAARQFFQNFDAATDMRADEPRADGSRTAGGTIDLGNYVAEIRCGFPAKELKLTEFFMDGSDQLAVLQSGGGAASGNIPNHDRPVDGVLPTGLDFIASPIIPCEHPGPGAVQCDAGVVRERNGNGFVMVFWPDA